MTMIYKTPKEKRKPLVHSAIQKQKKRAKAIIIEDCQPINMERKTE